MRLTTLLLCVALSSTSTVAAADPSPRERAHAFFAAGTEAFESGQYRAALRAYEEAYALEALPETAFSMGQAARLAFFEKKDPALLEEALHHYRRYLEDVPSGRRRAHAVQHVAALEALRALGAGESSDAGRARGRGTILLVVSRTPGAQARIGEQGPVDVPAALEVPAGPHLVVVSAHGHEESAVRWAAVEGRLVVASMDLRPSPAALEISAPKGAAIAVDGLALGVAPLERAASLAPGSHRVEVAMTGREAIHREVRVEPGETKAVGVGFAPRTAARLTSYGLFATSGLLALGSGASALVAWTAEERALELEGRVGRAQLRTADLAAHGDDVALRDGARTLSFVLLGAAVATGAAGAVVFGADAASTSSPSARGWVGPAGAGGRVTF